jgi:hypothetical protein
MGGKWLSFFYPNHHKRSSVAMKLIRSGQFKCGARMEGNRPRAAVDKLTPPLQYRPTAKFISRDGLTNPDCGGRRVRTTSMAYRFGATSMSRLNEPLGHSLQF